jgi:hypothetical protein
MAFYFDEGEIIYFYEPDAGLFAHRSVSGSCLNSVLAKLKAKIICMSLEGDPNDKLRARLFKNFKDNDRIQS